MSFWYHHILCWIQQKAVSFCMSFDWPTTTTMTTPTIFGACLPTLWTVSNTTCIKSHLFGTGESNDGGEITEFGGVESQSLCQFPFFTFSHHIDDGQCSTPVTYLVVSFQPNDQIQQTLCQIPSFRPFRIQCCPCIAHISSRSHATALIVPKKYHLQLPTSN